MTSGYPVLLEVPFEEKDDAKKRGARWDAANKLWYVTSDQDIDQFEPWWPKQGYRSCESSVWYIAETARRCRCGTRARVTAIVLPPGGVIQYDIGDMRLRVPIYLTEIRWLAPAVAEAMVACNDAYRRDFSKTLNLTYWMNHCGSCGGKQGDFFLYEDAQAFCPMRPEEAESITLTRIERSFHGLVTGWIKANFIQV